MTYNVLMGTLNPMNSQFTSLSLMMLVIYPYHHSYYPVISSVARCNSGSLNCSTVLLAVMWNDTCNPNSNQTLPDLACCLNLYGFFCDLYATFSPNFVKFVK